jgi:uroporphyrinogen-III synthase
MESLVLRHGGVPFAAPALSEVPTEGGPETTAAIERLASGGFDIVVLLTGVGTERLLAEAARMGRGTDVLDALSRTTTVVRGPKPSLVLKKRGITPTILVPPPHDTPQLVKTLGALQLAGRTVLVTSAGETMLEPAASLTARGADVTELLLYRWDLSADNEEALRRAVDEVVRGGIDAIAFTSQVQVRHLFDVAAAVGLTEPLRHALRDNVIVGAVGPTCADALRAYAVTPDVVPDLSRMGHLVLALARAVEAKHAGPVLGP